MIVNYFKIKKLKKLKRNSYYKKCKKDYQRLNEAGKKQFKSFKKYKDKWQLYNNVCNNWKSDTGLSMSLYGMMGFHAKARWYGYHTTDYDSWQYMATQMEWNEWASHYQLKHTPYKTSGNTGLGFGYGFLLGAALF